MRPRSYLGGWLLTILLVGGACTGAPRQIERPSHYFDKTEVDLEYGHPEATFLYRRPQGVQAYDADETEVDLATPRAARPVAPSRPPLPPPARPTPQTPLPGGDR